MGGVWERDYRSEGLIQQKGWYSRYTKGINTVVYEGLIQQLQRVSMKGINTVVYEGLIQQLQWVSTKGINTTGMKGVITAHMKEV